MIEVEVKAKIKNLENIRLKLKELNASKTKKELQKDIYFNSPIVNFAETDEAFRIRKTITNGKLNIFMTYKGPKIDSSSKTRKEVEVKIEDDKKAKDIFENIGFEAVRTVEKEREYYKYENYEISLDFVEGLEPYMEIETVLNEDDDYKNAQEGIFEIFKKLGINNGFERLSYLELLENKDKS
ncbi:class IV adenylate cyclase [Methanobrevibacter sp. OttesenSCG-928-K11]|nr:class IV adenylate cyclase [Methanobrevibacter sp. OttesenSCG-928-K11]